MSEGWMARARRDLVASMGGGGWGYRRGGAAAVEPTALAALGLLAGSPAQPVPPEVARAGETFVGLQRSDGSLGSTGRPESPGWPTPWAILLWRAIDGPVEPRRRAAAWLLAERVDAPPSPTGRDRIAGHDYSIPGWPWVEGTHPWVEPTALAVLALAPDTPTPPRVADGLRLLRDRAIDGGGWNYGNNTVFGRSLHPHPAPTGLALLALALDGEMGASKQTREAIGYLERTLPGVRAAASLGWGLLGLRAWGRAPAEADAWLAESAETVVGRPDAASRLGILLLASSDSSPRLLGIGRPGV